jgi:hypothetical protein
MALVDQIISAESGGDPNARNSRSSASGLGQFVNGTWLSTIKAHRPDIAVGKSDADLLALKTDPDLSRAMTAAYAADNGAILSKAGLPVTPGSTYLAHFAGPQGAVGILNADPSTPVSSILTAGAMKANPFLQGMTAADLSAWADRKVGGQTAAPQPAAPSAPLSMAGQSAPAQPSTPPELAPVEPESIQPDNRAQVLASLMQSMAAPDPAPMMLPMRKAPQLAFNFARRR